MATAKKQKKVSDARAKAQKAVEDAKSDAEKRVAKQALKLVKFREVAPPRVSRALAALVNVEKVFHRGGYAWESAHADKIVNALTDAVAKVKGAASATGETAKSSGFQL